MIPPFATGIGYDVHQFARNRRLVLGGVELPYELGLAGHSDADVLVHAIADSLLGAAGLRDIGHFFPNTDNKWKDASSLEFLVIIRAELAKLGWEIGNIDAMLIAEAPKISPHIDAMKANIGQAAGIPPERVNVKATTNERMGFIGRREGIAAIANSLLFRV